MPDDGRRYAWIVEDYKSGPETDWIDKPRSIVKNYKDANQPLYNPLPATVQTQRIFYPLNEPWQRFLHAAMKRGSFNTMSEADYLLAWRKTTRDSGGQFDGHTWDTIDKRTDPADLKIFTDYIQGLNLPPAHTYGDMMQQDLLFSRNIIRVTREEAGANGWVYYETLNHTMYDSPMPGTSPVRVGGRTKYLVDPPDLGAVWGNKWLIGWLTQSTTFELVKNTEWSHTRWPFFNGYGCPYLVLGRNGENRVRKYWTRPIPPGAEYSFYT